MRNIDMTPTPVRVLGSLAAISIAATSIAAALMVAPESLSRRALVLRRGRGNEHANGAGATKEVTRQEESQFARSSLCSHLRCFGRLSGRALLRRSGGPIRHARALNGFEIAANNIKSEGSRS